MVLAEQFVWITLTPSRVAFCRKLAARRHDDAVNGHRQRRNGAPADYQAGLALHEVGTLGEAASMLYLASAANRLVIWRCYVQGELNDLADIETWIDIKATPHNHHKLVVQRKNAPDWAYVLALTELAPRICLAGWCWGHEAKQPRFWRDPVGGMPAYFVPIEAPCMKPMIELAQELRRRHGKH